MEKRSWAGSELDELFTAYFGDRLSPTDIRRLTTTVVAALVDREANRQAEARQAFGDVAAQGHP